MQKLLFYLSILFVIGWTVFIWVPVLRQPALTAEFLLIAFFIWAAGIVPLGIIALILRPVNSASRHAGD
jgi:hypothetical protein